MPDPHPTPAAAPFTLDAKLVKRTRKLLAHIRGEEAAALQELLDRYLTAASNATGPDAERAKSWMTTARDRGTNLLREVEVLEAMRRRRTSC